MSVSSSNIRAECCTLASVLGTSVEIVHVVPDLAVLSRWRAHAETAVRDRVAGATAYRVLSLASVPVLMYVGR